MEPTSTQWQKVNRARIILLQLLEAMRHAVKVGPSLSKDPLNRRLRSRQTDLKLTLEAVCDRIGSMSQDYNVHVSPLGTANAYEQGSFMVLAERASFCFSSYGDPAWKRAHTMLIRRSINEFFFATTKVTPVWYAYTMYTHLIFVLIILCRLVC